MNKKKIEIFELRENINLILSDKTQSNASIGDYLIMFDETAWIRNWSDINDGEEFVEISYSGYADFIRANPQIFYKHT